MNNDNSVRQSMHNDTSELVQESSLDLTNLTGLCRGFDLKNNRGSLSRSSSETSLTLSPRDVLSLISPTATFPERRNASNRAIKGFSHVSAREEMQRVSRRPSLLPRGNSYNTGLWTIQDRKVAQSEALISNAKDVDLRRDPSKFSLKWEDKFSYQGEERDEYITASEEEEDSCFGTSKLMSSDHLVRSISSTSKQKKSRSFLTPMRERGKFKSAKEEFRRIQNTSKRFSELDKEKSLNSLGIKEKVNITWERVNPPEKRDLLALLYYRITNTINPDVKILISNTEFSCHKILLQCYSDYFDELFRQEDHSYINFNIEFKEITKSAFVAIYTWMISVDDSGFELLSPQNILETFIACKALKIAEFECQISSFLQSDELFLEETAYFQYQKAKELDFKPIMNMMLPRIKGFFMALVASKDYIELPIECILEFLSSDNIIVHSEVEVFLSAVRWLNADMEKRRCYTVEVMSCVRFCHMKPLEIVDIRNNPEFSQFTANAEIQRLIDDGLALAVKKALRQGGGGDWVDRRIPNERDWHCNSKQYVCYADFLEFLKELRANPKLMYSNAQVACGGAGDTIPHNTDPSMVSAASKMDMCTNREEESLQSKKVKVQQSPLNNHNKVIAELIARQQSGQLSPRKMKPPETKKPLTKRLSVQNVAATIIQAHWRGYKIRKRFNDLLPFKIPSQLLSARPPSPLSTILTPPKSLAKPSQISLPSKLRSTSSNENDMPLHEGLTNTSPSSASESVAEPGFDLQSNLESVYIFGGLDPNSLVGPNNTAVNVYRYVSSENRWDLVSKLPSPRYYHGAAVLKGRIYIAGGADPRKEETSSTQYISADVWSFDPIAITWRVEPHLKTARKNFGLVSAHGALYAVGGQDKNDRVLNSVEKLEPQNGCWVEVSPLAEGRAGLAASKHNHMIWVAGGVTAVGKQVITKSVECYDPKRNVWIPKPPLRAGRAFAAMVNLRGNLYIAGGATREGGAASSTPSIDMWDEREKMWLLKTEMTVPRHGHTINHLGNELMIIGGSTTIYMKCLASVEIWCSIKGTWQRGIRPIPGVITGHASVSLPNSKSRPLQNKLHQ